MSEDEQRFNEQRCGDVLRGHLSSRVFAVAPLNPVELFAMGKTSRFGFRALWQSPHDALVMVGLGVAVDLVGPALDPYSIIAHDWLKIAARTEVISPPNAPPVGVGPLLMGGFRFDPEVLPKPPWQLWPAGRMVVPTWVFTRYRGMAWVTFNQWLDEGEASDGGNTHMLSQWTQLVAALNPTRSFGSPGPVVQMGGDDDRWVDVIDRLAAEIRATHLQKVVIARQRQVRSKCAWDEASILNRLGEEGPSTYRFAFGNHAATFMGGSPERLLCCQDGSVETAALAGSAPRGGSPRVDRQWAQGLLMDPKNRREHALVVSTLTAALEDVATAVEVAPQPSLCRLRHIQHLYTPIRGRLRSGRNVLDLVGRIHPTPALGGWPTADALSHIRRLEPFDRGWYGGPVGWTDGAQNGEFAVAIRSGLIQENIAWLYAGAGIVDGSLGLNELQETEWKFQTMQRALEGGDTRG